MTERRSVDRYFPKILIDRGPTPIVFLDTFMWDRLLNQLGDLKNSLTECCNQGHVVVAITSVVSGELAQRNFLSDVRQLCGDSLVPVPVGRIAANQIIHALVCYMRGNSRVVLSWKLALSEVSVLRHPAEGLKNVIANLTDELNKARQATHAAKEQLVSAFVNVEREMWKGALKPYEDILDNIDAERKVKTGGERRTYETFFCADYFTDLPVVVLRSYLFAYLLSERDAKPNDIIDIYAISELLPYSNLFVMDRDQHNRLMRLQRDYPPVFGHVDKSCSISSFLKKAILDPVVALETFLHEVGNLRGPLS